MYSKYEAAAAGLPPSLENPQILLAAHIKIANWHITPCLSDKYKNWSANTKSCGLKGGKKTSKQTQNKWTMIMINVKNEADVHCGLRV